MSTCYIIVWAVDMGCMYKTQCQFQVVPDEKTVSNSWHLLEGKEIVTLSKGSLNLIQHDFRLCMCVADGYNYTYPIF